jgi:EmrB/QacA subfamily drug resistance transporter
MSSTTAKWLLPWLVAVAFFMESLDTTILNTAVPAIAQALGVAPLSMKAVLSSYTLSLAVFIPVSGWMADRFGTRRVFAAAIGIFTLCSFLCGISTNIHMLVTCRVLQGCGGALMLPVGRLTLVRTFARSELIRAMSFVAIPGLIGPMLGPLAGGLIIAYFHWSLIFFVNIPIGLVGLFLVYRHLPDYRAEQRRPLDVVGLILFGSGIALLSYVLEVFGEHTLSGIEMLCLLALSGALLAGYGLHNRDAPFPLLNLALFRIRTFRASVVGSFVTRLGIGGIPFMLPLLYQVGLGYTPIQSGLLMMPQAVASMCMKRNRLRCRSTAPCLPVCQSPVESHESLGSRRHRHLAMRPAIESRPFHLGQCRFRPPGLTDFAATRYADFGSAVAVRRRRNQPRIKSS